MSSFSSVVRKPGAAPRPKIPPRRNIQRKVAPISSSTVTPAGREIDSTIAAVHQDKDAEAAVGQQYISDADAQPVRPDPPALQDVQSPSALHESPADHPETGTHPSRIAIPEVLPTVELAQSAALSIPHSPEPTRPVTDKVTASPRSPIRKRKAVQEEDETAQHDVSLNRNVNGAQAILENEVSSIVPLQVAPGSPSTTRKKRKVTPKAAPALALSQSRTSLSPALTPTTVRQSLERESSQSQPPADLLLSATHRAASVSRLANSIDSETRARSVAQNDETAVSANIDATTDSSQATASASATKRTKRRKKTVAEQAAGIIANATGTKEHSNKRAVTPEDAQNHEIQPETVTMGELVKDRKLGKKSQLEQEMQENWAQIVERRKENRDRAFEAARNKRRKAYGDKIAQIAPVLAAAPVMPGLTVVNGLIVSDMDSRQIDRAARLEETAILDTSMGVREDKAYYKTINSATVGMKPSASRKFRWDKESTERFFKGLQWFGTDFLMIANMFPGLDRKQLKMKFIREENADKESVRQYLATRVPVDMEEYSKMTNTDFQDPKIVQAELEAEEQRLREEDNQRRIREGYVSTNAGERPVPTTETEEIPGNEGGNGDTSRFASMAREIMTPNRRQRQSASVNKKRGSKANRRPAEGVEEALGSIHEVPI